MVGVPGRSKACHTCRARRIKCGAEVPACRQCIKSKRICTGYQRSHAFILAKEMVGERSRLPPSTSTSTPSPLSCSSSPSSPGLVDELDSGKVMVSRWRLDTRSGPVDPSATGTSTTATGTERGRGTVLKKHKHPKPLTPEASLSLSTYITNKPPPSPHTRHVFRDALFSIFADPADNPGLFSFGERNDWIQSVSLAHMIPPLEDALLASCAARLGRQVSQPELIRESLRLYIRSLAQMRRSLSDANQSIEHLALARALLLYEASECPGGNMDGYVAHWKAASRLLQERGPEKHAEGLAHNILVVLRVPSALFGLQTRKKSFLAQSEWRDLPWSARPATKTQFDRLLDIYFDMPELAARNDALKVARHPQLQLVRAIATLHEGQRLQDALDAWYTGFRTTVPGGTMYHAALSKLGDDDEVAGKVFPVAFHFPAFIVAQNMVYYWAAQVYVRGFVCKVHAVIKRLLASPLDPEVVSCVCSESPDSHAACPWHLAPEQLPGFARREDWPIAEARSVCQSAEYFFQDGMRSFGPQIFIPILMIVKVFWTVAPGNRARESAWVEDVLARMRRSGNGLTGVLNDRSSQDVLESHRRMLACLTPEKPSSL